MEFFYLKFVALLSIIRFVAGWNDIIAEI